MILIFQLNDTSQCLFKRERSYFSDDNTNNSSPYLFKILYTEWRKRFESSNAHVFSWNQNNIVFSHVGLSSSIRNSFMIVSNMGVKPRIINQIKIIFIVANLSNNRNCVSSAFHSSFYIRNPLSFGLSSSYSLEHTPSSATVKLATATSTLISMKSSESSPDIGIIGGGIAGGLNHAVTNFESFSFVFRN